MDPVDSGRALTRALIDIDSTTGREQRSATWLAALLRDRGYSVLDSPSTQPSTPLGAGRLPRYRINVDRRCRRAGVVFSTHFDCVPPFFPSRLEERRALRPRLVRRQGHPRRAGRGRRTAACRGRNADRRCCSSPVKSAAATGRACRERACTRSRSYIINGEPTDNRLGVATRVVLRVRLRAAGPPRIRPFRSSGDPRSTSPGRRRSSCFAVSSWPDDQVLGRTHYTDWID